MTPYYHNQGERACGGIAQYWREPVDADDPLTASNIVYPDGTEADAMDPMCCHSCGKMLHFTSVDGCG